MSELDLDRLSRANPPVPNEVAKQTALHAALGEFDSLHSQKNAATTQGLSNEERQSSKPTSLWSALMSNLFNSDWTFKPAAMAALSAVVLIPIGGAIGWQVYDRERSLPPVHQAEELDTLKEENASQEGEQKVLAPARPIVTKRVNSDGTIVVENRTRQKVEQLPEVSAPLAESLAATSTESAPRIAMKRLGGQRSIAPMPIPSVVSEGENYESFDDNGVKAVSDQPVSTFSIDVDTASYSRVRRALLNGNLPRRDMVRVEEMVNYFSYDYPLPESKAQPFKPTARLMPTPWNADTKLLHIGIKGFDIPKTERPAANLVFLLDVSGSMSDPDKLPLLIKSFRLLLNKLEANDKVSIVTYAGRSATVLEPTPASERQKILSALQNLQAGGSTAGAQGIEEAYRLAQASFIEGGVNRVMLATDGDFNVGISDPEQLKNFIAKKRNSGIFLSVFGFGRGNINDALMQKLAQNGNGQAAYIDTLSEAQKVLVQEAGSTLFPIAKDVKIQVEFNPTRVAEYRLIGYETRSLKREDFNNDKVDAGDIGSGHSVTAIYEITPVGSAAVLNDPLRYGKKSNDTSVAPGDEYAFIKMRYKMPDENKSKLLTTPVTTADDVGAFSNADADSRFSVAVAAFGQKLRDNSALTDLDYETIANMASDARGDDQFGYRSAFVQLVRLADSLRDQ